MKFLQKKDGYKMGDKRFIRVSHQCPVCKKHFSSYYHGYNDQGVKLHISKTAKNELFAQGMGVIKKAPHFIFYKKNTEVVEGNLKLNINWK